MTELKTTKDHITTSCDDVCPGKCNGTEEYKEWEKQEAIKWLKTIKTNEDGEECMPYKKGNSLFFGEWVKHFFNITDEDINEVKAK